ncbi:hypothetical protein FTX61_12370 [Nitriliruptoraceae bacterium ZYF776]|nr:hypothetical protein [Profundirhabdus halotolerans]
MPGSPRPSPLGALRRATATALLVAVVAACSSATDERAAPALDPQGVLDDGWEPAGSLALRPRTLEGLEVPASQDGDRLLLHTESGDVDFWTGFNVGATVPGHQPGELAVDRETWDRWLPMIAATGAHAIRVYTIQPPHFYEALQAHNEAHPDRPVYLVHGVWIPEEEFLATADLWDDEVVAAMERDVRDAVAVVHGKATLPERPGFASGEFTADVSPWTVSWALGIEMDPTTTRASDAANADVAPYEGAHVRSAESASATETWLARMLDVLAGEEAARGRSVPLTFTNWPTTDPLEHPSEPLEEEDLVRIDANHVVTTEAWPAGRYASYHAYPYYPDFQRYEPGIADFELDGEVDNYAGYLQALRDHHDQLPVVVLEFGVPTSLGSAHRGPLGRDQGGHREADAMAIEADLLDVQRSVGVAGGFLFAWQDEWFKFTWNTIDLELPGERRSLWHNPLTNESYFGFLAHEPGIDERVVTVDGTGDDWAADNSQAIHEGPAPLEEVRAVHDAERLYLRLQTDGAPWEDGRGLAFAFDLVDGGGGPLPEPFQAATTGADVVVVFTDGEAELFTRASNDVNTLRYGRRFGYLEVDDADVEPGSGVWAPARQIVNRPLTLPTTGEELPAEWHELNPLPRGTADPTDGAFDNRTVWAASDGVLELRLPWALLGLADPSSHQALVVSADGELSTTTVDGFEIDVHVGDGPVVSTAGYGWDEWNRVDWHERVKDGAGVLVERLRELASP